MWLPILSGAMRSFVWASLSVAEHIASICWIVRSVDEAYNMIPN